MRIKNTIISVTLATVLTATGLAVAPTPAAVAATPGEFLARDVPGHYIVVLGARMNPDGSPPSILSRRLDRAAALWHAHPGNRVVATGGNSWWLPVPEAVFMQTQLALRGVLPTSVDVEARAMSTAENARYTVGILKSRNASGAVVVTNGFHMKRALTAFRTEAERQGTDQTFVAAYA